MHVSCQYNLEPLLGVYPTVGFIGEGKILVNLEIKV